jgi:ubiquinone/menaquinone biosynthesis C-methylase UbiE
MKDNLESKLFHPSSRPAGHGITIGTPRLYDVSAALLFRRRRSYRGLLAAGDVQRGARVLDVGCGPGYFTRMLAEAVGPEGSVSGIDAAPEMIEYASKKARRLSNCRFQTGTAESLAFPDAAFDVVVSSLMMHHLPEEGRLGAVREMQRVLRPGGTLLLADFRMPQRGVCTWSHRSPATRPCSAGSRRWSRWWRRRASPNCAPAMRRRGSTTSGPFVAHGRRRGRRRLRPPQETVPRPSRRPC